MRRFCLEGWKNSTELRQSDLCLFSKRGLLFGTTPLQKTGNFLFCEDQKHKVSLCPGCNSATRSCVIFRNKFSSFKRNYWLIIANNSIAWIVGNLKETPARYQNFVFVSSSNQVFSTLYLLGADVVKREKSEWSSSAGSCCHGNHVRASKRREGT